MAQVCVKVDLSIDDLTRILDAIGRDIYPKCHREQPLSSEECDAREKLHDMLLVKAIKLNSRLKKEQELDEIEAGTPELETKPTG
jgi:hypothetical protein